MGSPAELRSCVKVEAGWTSWAPVPNKPTVSVDVVCISAVLVFDEYAFHVGATLIAKSITLVLLY